MSLTGVAVLLILDPESAADAEQRGLRQRVVAAGGSVTLKAALVLTLNPSQP